MPASERAPAGPRRRLAVLMPAFLAVVVAGVALTAGIVASLSSGTGGTGGTGGGNPPAAGGAGKGARAVPSGRADPPQAPATPGARWIAGPAGRLLAAVTTDLGTFSADQRAGDARAARGAGVRLAADARAALTGPMPPADAAVYRSALNDFERIGADAASGDFRAASALLAPANLGVMTVTAAADPPARVNPPAQVKDPGDG